MRIGAHPHTDGAQDAEIYKLLDKFTKECKTLKAGEEYAWKDITLLLECNPVDIPLADEILDVLNEVRKHPKEFANFVRGMLKVCSSTDPVHG